MCNSQRRKKGTRKMSYKVQLVAAQETPPQVLEEIVASVPPIFPFPLQFIVEQKRYSVGEPSIENSYFFFDTSSNEPFIDVSAVLKGYTQKHPLLLLFHQPYTLDRTLENSYRQGYLQEGYFLIGGTCQPKIEPPILTAAIRRTASTGNLIVAAHEIAHSICDRLHDLWVTENGIRFQRSHCTNDIRKKNCIMNPSPIGQKDNLHEYMHVGFCQSCAEKLKSSYTFWFC